MTINNEPVWTNSVRLYWLAQRCTELKAHFVKTSNSQLLTIIEAMLMVSTQPSFFLESKSNVDNLDKALREAEKL